jgi:cobalt transporter subunit CbtA
MLVFRNIFFLAVAVGLLAGIVMTVLQASFTVPLILAAETYEAAAPAEPAHAHDAAAPAAHDHDDEAWAPADGFQRTAFTVAANVVTAVGFALLLVAAAELAAPFGAPLTGWRSGLLWGLAGFAVFTLAPGLGLPPELPAMPAAELLPRQLWWIATVAAAAAGMALIFLGKSPALAALGLALLVLQHLVGAQQPASFESPIPEGLHHRFVVAVTMTNLVFWALLGTLAGLLRPRVEAWLAAPRDRLA